MQVKREYLKENEVQVATRDVQGKICLDEASDRLVREYAGIDIYNNDNKVKIIVRVEVGRVGFDKYDREICNDVVHSRTLAYVEKVDLGERIRNKGLSGINVYVQENGFCLEQEQEILGNASHDLRNVLRLRYNRGNRNMYFYFHEADNRYIKSISGITFYELMYHTNEKLVEFLIEALEALEAKGELPEECL